MAAQEIRKARFANRIDTLNNWKTERPTLYRGELGLVTDNSGNLLYGIVGDGSNDAGTIIENPTTYNDNFFYSGKGAQYEFNVPATTTTIGGFKLMGTSNEPLIMTSKTTGGKKEYLDLSPDLITGWNSVYGCFEVPKLFIKELYTLKETEEAVFKAEKIILRDDTDEPNPTPAMEEGDYSGITVNNIQEGVDGFMGLNYQGLPHTLRGNIYYPMALYNPSINKNTKGYVSINPGDSLITVTPHKALTIKRGTKEEVYNGIDNNINLEYPTITLNNQSLVYDENSNTYSASFDGGLTEENAEKIAKIDVIESTMLTKEKITSGLDIKITGDSNITIEHKKYTTTNAGGQEIEIPSGYVSFITGLEIENGHITKITTTSYKFK